MCLELLIQVNNKRQILEIIKKSMSWSETDDTELEASYNRLRVEQGELETKLKSVMVIITNAVAIKNKSGVIYNDNNIPEIGTILPKDKWGEDMTDEYRLKIKDECITKTNELLGVENE